MNSIFGTDMCVIADINNITYISKHVCQTHITVMTILVCIRLIVEQYLQRKACKEVTHTLSVAASVLCITSVVLLNVRYQRSCISVILLLFNCVRYLPLESMPLNPTYKVFFFFSFAYTTSPAAVMKLVVIFRFSKPPYNFWWSRVADGHCAIRSGWCLLPTK